jgi:hypothetical protein
MKLHSFILLANGFSQAARKNDTDQLEQIKTNLLSDKCFIEILNWESQDTLLVKMGKEQNDK